MGRANWLGIAAAVLLSGCGSSAESNNASIVGVWHPTSGDTSAFGMLASVEYRDGGVYSETSQAYGTATGTYSIDGGLLTMSIPAGGGTPVQLVRTFKVNYAVSETTLSWIWGNGSSWQFSK